MSNKITLYTAHHCPFAHRVQIILRELNLEFETCLVDITVPRTPSYLSINPNGMVPALAYNDLVLTESGLICQFLADTYPSHLVTASSAPEGALQRFKIGYFVDTYSSKAHKFFDSVVFSHSAEVKAEMARKYVDAVVGFVEPLLAGSGPFFGGSDRLTLIEVSKRSPKFMLVDEGRILMVMLHLGIDRSLHIESLGTTEVRAFGTRFCPSSSPG
jgi:glutathione S-transferase